MREKIQKSSYLLTVVMTCLTLIAFAANSVLCRLALGDSNIDPAGFTAIRMISGAFMLALIVLLSRKQRVAYQRFELRSVMSLKNTQGWISSAMLFGYAVFFLLPMCA